MAEVDNFLDELAVQMPLSTSERERIRALWPEAERAADECERHMPTIGWLSFRKRYRAFMDICQRLDRLQTDGSIDDEQAQLALTLLRRRSRSYRKAENMFAARARGYSLGQRQQLPLTAQQLIKAMQFPLQGSPDQNEE
ncbi:hypothetical protein E4656_08910 [Natronospirillum operosum]|uniref:Uncharacterized protein n=1 Tax=Natronospirillum operosum TaxID=2759953 RepID=A0A4Z0WCR2_9GAMM|nr:hypothetical protein [Natronospirillum operosum]TGG94275.1 hypothetical protein E4656_08910 [Natronospirillum operosum]